MKASEKFQDVYRIGGENDMISVIVPIYNAEKYLKESIDSIINQTYRDLEIILVDDGSTDNSLQMCKEFAQNDSRIKVVHQENRGILGARKTGISEAQGEYISFIDSDDWIDSCFYEKLHKLQLTHDADIIVSGCRLEQGKQSHDNKNMFSEGIYRENDLVEKIYPQMMYYRENRDLFYTWGILQYAWNKIYKRDIIIPCIEDADAEIVDAEDVSFVYQACLKAKSIYVDNQPYYHYRIHNNSVCNRPRSEKYFANTVKLHRHLNRVFSQEKNGDLLLEQVPYFLNMYINNGMDTVFGFRYIPKYSGEYLLPEISYKEGTRVCIYGVGKVGKSFYKQLLTRDEVEIVSWTDSNHKGKKIGGCYIDSPEQAIKKEWDFVLLAVAKEEQAEQMKEWLLANGVTLDSIIWKQPKRICDGYELDIKGNN